MAEENEQSNRPPKVKTGNFRFCEAMINGRIVRDGPERKTSGNGDRVEATLLVGLWDPRQRAERENPVFVRVKAFAKNNPEAFQQLEACQRLDRVAVAGNMIWNAWKDNEGNIRQELQLLADHVLREDRFPSLKTLLEPEDTRATGSEEQAAPDSHSDDVPF